MEDVAVDQACYIMSLSHFFGSVKNFNPSHIYH